MKTPITLLALLLVGPPALSSPAAAQEIRVSADATIGGLRARIGYGTPPVRSSYARPRHAPPRARSHRRFVPGHYETVTDRVWIPAGFERVWIEPLYRLRDDGCGNRVRVLVRDGYEKHVWRPGRYEYRERRVWVPGCWTVSRRYR